MRVREKIEWTSVDEGGQRLIILVEWNELGVETSQSACEP